MKKYLSCLLAAVWLLGAAASFAAPKTDVYIGITSSGGKKLPLIAMPDFIASAEAKSAAETVFDTLRADILYTRYFDVSQDGPEFDAKAIKDTLKGWNKKRANYLIGGDISYAAPNYTIKLYVYDVATRAPVFAKAFKGNETSLRRLAHIASDQIIQTLTGHRGIADTKIAFSNNSTKNKEIYVVDYDGHNLKKLTNDKSIALLPRWSKDGRIYYFCY